MSNLGPGLCRNKLCGHKTDDGLHPWPQWSPLLPDIDHMSRMATQYQVMRPWPAVYLSEWGPFQGCLFECPQVWPLILSPGGSGCPAPPLCHSVTDLRLIEWATSSWSICGKSPADQCLHGNCHTHPTIGGHFSPLKWQVWSLERPGADQKEGSKDYEELCTHSLLLQLRWYSHKGILILQGIML